MSLCEECDAAPVAFVCMECQQNQCANCEAKIHKKGNRIYHKRNALAVVTPVRLGIDTSTSVMSPPAPRSPSRSTSTSITPVKASPVPSGRSGLPYPGVGAALFSGTGPPFPGVAARSIFAQTGPQSPTSQSLSPTSPQPHPASTPTRPSSASVASVLPTPPSQPPPPSLVTPTPPPHPPLQPSHPPLQPSHPPSPQPPSVTGLGIGLPGMVARPRGSSKTSLVAPPPPPDEDSEFLPPPPEFGPRKSSIGGGKDSGRTSPDKKQLSEPEKPPAAKQLGFTPISTPVSQTRAVSDLPSGFSSVPAPPAVPPGEEDELENNSSAFPPPPPEYEDEESDDDTTLPPPPEVEFADSGSNAAMGIFQHSLMESSRSYVIPSFLPPPEDYTDSSPESSRIGTISVSQTRPLATTFSSTSTSSNSVGGKRGLDRPMTEPILAQKGVDPKLSLAKKGVSTPKPDGKTICGAQEGAKCMSFAVRSGYCLRHVWKSYDKIPEPNTQEKVAKEIITTERTYQQGLGVAIRRFLKGLIAANEFEKSIVSPELITQIFHNIEDIYALSTEMCTDLEEIRYKPFLTKQIGLTLLHYSHRFKIYQTYLENYDSAIQRLAKAREENPQFDLFLKINEKAEDNMALQSFLIMPIQRLPRYLLLLKELIKNTPESDSDLADMNLAHAKIKQIADYINNCLHLKAASDKVRVLEDMFEKDDRFVSLAHPRRFLIKQGQLDKRFSKKSLHLGSAKAYIFFLFNDILVYASASKFAKSGGKGSYQMKNVLPISDMKVKELSNPKQRVKDIQIKVKKREYILSATDPKTHQEWMEALNQAVAKFQQNETSLAGGESSKKLQSVMLGQKS